MIYLNDLENMIADYKVKPLKIEELVKGITQQDIDNDVNVEIISAYGGMTCWKGKISEVLEVVNEDDRCANRDFFVVLSK